MLHTEVANAAASLRNRPAIQRAGPGLARELLDADGAQPQLTLRP